MPHVTNPTPTHFTLNGRAIRPPEGAEAPPADRDDLRALLVQLNAMVDDLPEAQLRCYVGAIEAVRDGRWAGSCRTCTSPVGLRSR